MLKLNPKKISDFFLALISFAFLLSISLFFIEYQFQPGLYYQGIDFYVFWVVAQLASENLDALSKIYDLSQSSQILGAFLENDRETLNGIVTFWSKKQEFVATQYPSSSLHVFTATPFAYAIFSFFINSDFGQSLITFKILSSVSFVLGFLIIGRLLSYSYKLLFLLCAVFQGLFGPVMMDLLNLNNSRIQFFLLAIMLAAFQINHMKYRCFTLAFLAVLSIFFKPSLFLIYPVLLLFVFNKRMSFCYTLLGSIFATAVVLFSTYLVFDDLSIWSDWFRQASLMPHMAYIVNDVSNFSLINFFNQIQINNFAVQLLLVIVAAGLCSLLYLKIRSEDIQQSFVAVIAASVCLNLLFSPMVWYHYFVLLIPLIFYALKRNLYLAIIFVIPMFIPFYKFISGKPLQLTLWIGVLGLLIMNILPRRSEYALQSN